MWRELIAEINALGWRAFAFGPEVHLVLPFLTMALAMVILFGGKRR